MRTISSYLMQILHRFFSHGFTFLILMICTRVGAQLNYYTFSQTTQTYTEITGGTDLGTASNDNLVFMDPEIPQGGQSNQGPGFEIGFPFTYRGIVYDRFGLSNNGWICLGRSQDQETLGFSVYMASLTTQPISTPGVYDTLRSCIAAFGGYILGNGTSSDLRFELVGDAPDRTLVIQWKNYKLGPSFYSGASSINTQIRLNESDQSIDIRFGVCSFANFQLNASIQVGLGGLKVHEFSNRTTPSNWNATSAGTAPNSSCPAYVVYPPPASGMNFQWDPPTCVPPSHLNNDSFGYDSLSFSWEEPYTNPMDGYEYALTTSTSPPITGSTTALLNVSFQDLIEGTLYYFHVRTLCDMEDHSAWITIPARTLCLPTVPPYLENFDAVTAPEMPGCVRVDNEDAYSPTWSTITTPYTVISPPNAARLADPYAQTDDWLFLPALTLSSDTTYINKMDMSSYPSDNLDIYIGDFPSADHMTPIGTLGIGNPIPNYILITPDSTGTYFIGYKSQLSAVQFLDNIEVRAYTCFSPDSIQVVTNQPGMVSLKWNAPELGASSYEYIAGQYFNYPYQGTVFTSDTMISLTGLNPSQPYSFIMRSSCGGDNYSPWIQFEFVTASANDECPLAVELFPSAMEYCDQSIEGSTIGASASGQAVGSCGGQPDDDVWFKFIATARSHNIKLTPSCSQNNRPARQPTEFTSNDCEAYTMELYSDSCDGAFLDCINLPAGTFGTDFVKTDLSIGITYFLRVFGTEVFESGSNFNICVTSFPQPVNDSCAGAEIIISNETFCNSLAYGNLAGATPSFSPSSLCQGAPYYDLWYKFAVIDTIQIVEVSFGNEADGVVEVFSGTSCGTLTSVTCSDITTIGPEVLVLDSLTIGDSLWIRVFDATGAGVNSNFEICVRTPNANEFCSGAEEVLTVSGPLMVDRLDANTLSAFGSGGCTPFYADDDLWYSFVADHDTHLIAVAPRDYPAIVEPVVEFFGTDCDSAGVICSDEGQLFLDSLSIGEEYYFRVYSADSLTGKGGFALSVVAPPNNIFCFSPDTLQVNDSSECVLVNECTNVGSGLDNSVWFTFVAQQSTQIIHLDDQGTFFGYMTLFYSCDSLFSLAYSSNEYLVAHDLVPGHNYSLRVTGGFSLSNLYFLQSSFSICIIAPAPNDECSGAITILPTGQCDSLIFGSTLYATPSILSGPCHPQFNDVWYSFVATATFHKIQVYADDGFYLPRGELYANSCGGQSLVCFQYSYDTHYATSNFTDLTIGHTYYIRLMISGGATNRGTFAFCLWSPPINDECSYPVEMITPLTSKCTNPVQGTTINSTNPSGDQNNVWYSFTSINSSIAIKVTPQTNGFDPGIRFWHRSANGGADDQYCVLSGYEYQPINSDDTHAEGQPEVLVIASLTPFREYLIEVYDSDSSQQSGDFEFCLFNPGNGFQIYSAEYETYDMADAVSAGGWHQAVCKVILHVSGSVNMPHLTNARVNTLGSTDPNDIQSLSFYYPPITSVLSGSAGFDPFGGPTPLIGGYPPPIQLGQSSSNPIGEITFAGDIPLIGISQLSNTPMKRNYKEYLYLVYDISCEADTGHVMKGHCTSLIFDGDEEFIPYEKFNPGLPVISQRSYETKQDGAWENGSTWVCGEPPPDGYDNDQTNINHHVFLSDTAVTGDLEIHYLKSLSLDSGSVLTLGRSSLGSQTGYSNKVLDCENGSLSLHDAVLNVNGRVYVGNNDYSNIGTFSAINSVLNLDGNDGTATGSATYLPLLIGTSNFVSDNFTINILDPSYQGSFSDFIYNPNISAPRFMSGTLRLGGGDDTGEAYGFIIQSYSNYGGFLIIDSIIVDGGLKTNQRAVHSGGNFLACKHLMVSEGAEFVGRAAIQGNLLNNGLMTIPSNFFLSFGGDVDIVRQYTNATHIQSISGTGFFRSSLTDPIPTSQLDNEISNLYVANIAGGLNLNLPLGIREVLRIRQGRINTSDSTMLTLGNEMSTGTLATDPFEPNIFNYQPFSGNVSSWFGGHVNGPMRRWFNGTPTSEKSIMPVGHGYTLRPISFQFANTSNGFLEAEYVNEFPGNEGMPLVDEQDTTLNSASFGYWRVDSSNVSGTYTASVNALGTTYDGNVPISELSNVRLIKRPNGGAWVNTGSTTTEPPTSLSLVKAEGLSGFSDFALGTQYCKVVTNGNDDGIGSLRFAIAQCSNPEDYIYIAEFIDSIFLVSDTIILDKNLSIFHSGNEKVVIQTTSSSPVFKTNPGVLITLNNIEIHSGGVASSKALLNNGNTILWNVDIINSIPGEIPVMNTGILEISETVQIKNQ